MASSAAAAPPSSATTQPVVPLEACDYLVVGAGAVSMAFLDTLFTEQPAATAVLVDKKSAPGGHWLDAYGHVRLHQPSLLYGVASKALEGSWLYLFLTGTLPWTHRAPKKQILSYYASCVEGWKAAGRLRFYPGCTFDFEPDQDGLYKFASDTGAYRIRPSVKLVNGTVSENLVPSQTPPLFPVDAAVNVITPNELHDSSLQASSKQAAARKAYVVMGAGKTAMDAVVFLQTVLRVPTSRIHWVIPADVWMLARWGSGDPWSYSQAMIANGGDRGKAVLQLEAEGKFVRLDPNILPTRFKFPVIGKQELEYLRKVKQVIRKGRITALVADGSSVRMEFGAEQEPEVLSADHVFVHCTAPGPFNPWLNGDNLDFTVFNSDSLLSLWMLFPPPVPFSQSCIAYLESARRKGTWDREFACKLVAESGLAPASDLQEESDDAIIRHLVMGLNIVGDAVDHMATSKTLATFCAIADKDPLNVHKWMKSNRLSFFSIPGFKGGVYETMCKLTEEHELLGFNKTDGKMFALLSDKLKVMEGL